MDRLTRQFWDNIEKHFGIRYSESKNKLVLEMARSRALDLGLNRVETYLELFAGDKLSDAEYRFWATQLTINETYFFRDEGQWEAIRESVIPAIIRRNAATREFRAVCLGGSTGEEAYTLALILQYYFKGLAGWNISIHSTDIKEEALQRGREGRYAERSIRGIPREISDQYLSGGGSTYILHPDIRRMVQFHYHNLMDLPGKLPFPEYDLVICRNVIIYFAKEVALQTLRGMLRLLPTEGILMLGHSEGHLTAELELTPLFFHNAVLYRKRKCGIAAIEREIEPWLGLRRPNGYPAATASSPAAEPRKPEEPARVEPIHYPDQMVGEAERCIEQQEYAEARRRLEAVLHQLPMYTPAHYLLGVLYQTLQEEEKARRQFERVIYLDPNHILAAFQLAMLHQRIGNLPAAARLYSRILALTHHYDKEYIIDRQTELTIGFIQMICTNFLRQEEARF